MHRTARTWRKQGAQGGQVWCEQGNQVSGEGIVFFVVSLA